MGSKLVTGLNATGNVTPLPWSSPVQQVTIVDTRNLRFPRLCVLSNDGVRVTVKGFVVGIALTDIINVAIAQEPSLASPPQITTQPVSQATDSTPVHFSVVATVEDPSYGISYLWQMTAPGPANWVSVFGAQYSGQTSSTLTINDLTGLGGYQYRCVLTTTVGGNPGQSVTSLAATLTIP
jgi:hypothetical protein